jgi:hypothetical protein
VRLDVRSPDNEDDKEKGHSYVIKADSFRYNQTSKLLNAIGNGNID